MTAKRALPFASAEIRLILLDIEGTTTPIDFVFKTLFPFASARVDDFFAHHAAEFETKALVAELRALWQLQAAQDQTIPAWDHATHEAALASAARFAKWLIARDSKATALKTLQGKIWEQGFRSGELRGEVYPDVAPAFARWREQQRSVAIFSSGSVLAQKLLFAHSTSGDLSPYIAAYFDTTTGPKREPGSYATIMAILRLAPRQSLFVSDVPQELDAARTAGLATAHSLRPGVGAAQDYFSVTSFDELF